MLDKRDVSYYWRLGYAQAGLGVAIIFLSFVAGVAAKYETGDVHAMVPYYVGIMMLVQGAIILIVAKSGKRWLLGIWLFIFFCLFVLIGITMVLQRSYGAMFYEKFPCYLQHNPGKSAKRCVCANNRYDMIIVNGATTVEPCLRALNTLYIMSNSIYALSFFGLIVNLLTFVLACNDTCCLTCRRTGDVPQFVIPGTAGQPGTTAVAMGQTTVTYRTDDQPGSSPGTAQLAPAKDVEQPHAF